MSINISDDCISRQAAIDALCRECTPVGECGADCLEVEVLRKLPPVEPQPVCEDAIRCYEFLKERIGSKITDNAEEFEKWFERMAWHVQKCNEHYTEEMRNVSEDTISRQDAIDSLHAWFKDGFEEDKWWNSTHVLAALEDVPSAQPEIIHCRECKHHRQDNHGLFYCSRKEYGYGWGLNDFCSDAERRTDDH